MLDELVNGAVTKTYTYGLQRISENQLSGSTWTPTFYGYDGHGSVRFTTSTAGVVGNTYQFDAFGAPIASTGTIANTYLYSGERFDSSLNLYQLRARFYNALTGRFETLDPYQGDTSVPATLHKYVYAGNNPVNFVDPTGQDDIEEYAELTQRANAKYPLKVGNCEAHHIIPKYLGGDPNGPLAIIPAPFHQLITNAFRDLWPYGAGVPSPDLALEIVRNVYDTFNLSLGQLECAGL